MTDSSDWKFLATLGHGGDEKKGSVVLQRTGEVVKDLLTGEELSLDEVRGYLEQAEGYVQNLKEAIERIESAG